MSVFIDKWYILTKNCFASNAYLTFYYNVSAIKARVVWILNNLSKWRQFKLSGFGSYSFWEKIDFVFFDFAVFVTLPDLFILEDGPFDLMDNGPLRYGAFLDWFVLTADFIDLETSDFFPLVLRLKTVPFYSSGSSSYSSYPN